MLKNMVHTIDAWLWRRGFHHPEVRAVARAEMLFAGSTLAVGAGVFAWTQWPVWFGAGAAVFAWSFCGLAHYLLRARLTAYSTALLLGLLLRSGGRLLLTAVMLYVALIICSAPAAALFGGVIAGSVVALGTYALVGFAGHN